jgi:hypothetical protein
MRSKLYSLIDTIRLLDCDEIFRICINKDIACVLCRVWQYYYLRFYKLPKYELLAQYCMFNPVMTTLKDFFVVYDGKCLIWFDLNCKMMSCEEYSWGESTDILVTDDKLYICLPFKNSIVHIGFEQMN